MYTAEDSLGVKRTKEWVLSWPLLMEQFPSLLKSGKALIDKGNSMLVLEIQFQTNLGETNWRETIPVKLTGIVDREVQAQGQIEPGYLPALSLRRIRRLEVVVGGKRIWVPRENLRHETGELVEEDWLEDTIHCCQTFHPIEEPKEDPTCEICGDPVEDLTQGCWCWTSQGYREF